jgi:hypothetical protein
MQAFRRFHRLSGRAGLFPTPWIIKHKISLDPRTPLHTTGISDVYRGKRQGQRFALKSLRLSGNDQMVVRKVSRKMYHICYRTLMSCSLGIHL